MAGFNSSQELDLRQNSYHGVILEDKDPKVQGRYKVHIPELHPLIKEKSGIWCKNQLHKWRIGPSEDYTYGSYYPLQPGTKVLIKFYQNDFHSGYIDRIVSDQIQKTNPKIGCEKNPEATTDRDDMYVIYKTPKYHNLFAVLEKTTDGANRLTQQLIPNSIHLYYNYRRSTMIINEDGIHWFSMNNRGVTIEGNNSEWVNQNEKIYVQENRDVYVNGNQKRFVKGDVDMLGKSALHNTYVGEVDFQSATHFAVDAPAILMNCGATKPAKQADTNKGEDEIIAQHKLDMRIVGHQKRDDTYYGEPSKRTDGGSPPRPKQVGDKEKSRLPQGQNDRYSSVGAEQTGAEMRPFPGFPSRGSITQMLNLPNITSLLMAPLAALTGVATQALSNIQSMPAINAITSATGQIAGQIGSTLQSATSGLSNAVAGGLANSIGGLSGSLNGVLGGISGGLNSPLSALNNVTGGIQNLGSNLGNLGSTLGNLTNVSSGMSGINLNSKIQGLTNSLNTIPSYNLISGFSSDTLNSANTIKNLIGNANSVSGLVQNLQNNIQNTLNSNINNVITNPITNAITSTTYGVDQLKNLLNTQNVANAMVNSIGANNIGQTVANEIKALTSNNFISGVIGTTPGGTTAASIVDLVGNKMGLGGILSDLACNTSSGFNFEISIDNPLDKINSSLENLKTSLSTLLDAFDLNNLGNALNSALGLSAIQDAINSLNQLPTCQTLANTILQTSQTVASRNTTQTSSLNSAKSWYGATSS